MSNLRKKLTFWHLGFDWLWKKCLLYSIRVTHRKSLDKLITQCSSLWTLIWEIRVFNFLWEIPRGEIEIWGILASGFCGCSQIWICREVCFIFQAKHIWVSWNPNWCLFCREVLSFHLFYFIFILKLYFTFMMSTTDVLLRKCQRDGGLG